jgi:hypothetical protein
MPTGRYFGCLDRALAASTNQLTHGSHATQPRLRISGERFPSRREMHSTVFPVRIRNATGSIPGSSTRFSWSRRKALASFVLRQDPINIGRLSSHQTLETLGADPEFSAMTVRVDRAPHRALTGLRKSTLSKRHGNQLSRFTVRAPANVQRFHSLPNDAAQALFCTLCARWVGAVVLKLGGENTPRRSSAL